MDSKGLRVKRILLVFALIGLVFGVSVVKGTATQRVSVLYTSLNVQSWTEYEVPSGNYTAPYTVRITPNLTWNATTSTARFQMSFQNASATYRSWTLQLADSALMSVIYNETGIDTIGFTMGTEMTVKVQSDGFTVNNGSGVQVEHYADFTAPLDGVFVRGLVDDTVTAGTIIVEFNDGGDYGVDIITSMIPLIVTIAVLGAVIKQFNKFKL